MLLIIRVLYIIRMIRIRLCTLLFRFLQRQEADSFSAAADVMDGDDGAVVLFARRSIRENSLFCLYRLFL